MFENDLRSQESWRASSSRQIGIVEKNRVMRITLRAFRARSSQPLGVGKVRHTKVANLDHATIVCPQQICGLNVSMYDPLVMYCALVKRSNYMIGGTTYDIQDPGQHHG